MEQRSSFLPYFAQPTRKLPLRKQIVIPDKNIRNRPSHYLKVNRRTISFHLPPSLHGHIVKK
jgi:hypothetical protein